MIALKFCLNEIRHCYQQLLQRAPRDAGQVKVQFIIGANGRVTSAVVESATISDVKFQGCVTRKIARWRFPNLRGTNPITVGYPFVFAPL